MTKSKCSVYMVPRFYSKRSNDDQEEMTEITGDTKRIRAYMLRVILKHRLFGTTSFDRFGEDLGVVVGKLVWNY